MSTERKTGRVTRYDAGQGQGVISTPDGKEVPFDRGTIMRSKVQGLCEGDRVEFDIVAGVRGPEAANLRRL